MLGLGGIHIRDFLCEDLILGWIIIYRRGYRRPWNLLMQRSEADGLANPDARPKK
jgi:hypothetical protein